MPKKEKGVNTKAAIIKQQVGLLKTLDPEFLECRVGATGHRWHRCRPHKTPPKGQNLRVDQCDHCDMIREIYSGKVYGEVIGRRYDPPPGYYLKRPEGFGTGRLVSPAAVRLVTANPTGDLPEVRLHD